MTEHMEDTWGAATPAAPTGAPPRHCSQHPEPEPGCDACARYNTEFIEWAKAAIESERTTGRRLRVTLGSDVKTQRVRWVMQDWIPAGSLTLLAGREGLGKSTMAASLCAQITNGTLEDGELYGFPRNVIYVHSEDAREFTVAPRLLAAGADMSRVLFVDVATEMTENGTLILPTDTLALERVIADHKVAFVVLDAATSSMSSVLSGKDDRAVRQYLEPLSQLAARQDCVVLGLCHFGKRDGADTGKLILGSIAWSQVARSVLSVAQDDETGNLIVTNTKANLAPRVRSMEANIRSALVQTDDGPADIGVLEWLGETSRDARELLSEDQPAPHDRAEAEMWLEDYLLEQGSAPAKQVKDAARKSGISEATVKRAAKALGVVYTTGGFPRTSRWELPQSAQSAHAPLTHEPTEPTEPTGRDQGKDREPTGAESQSAHTPVNELTEPDRLHFATVTPLAGATVAPEVRERACLKVVELLGASAESTAKEMRGGRTSKETRPGIAPAIQQLLNEGVIASRTVGTGGHKRVLYRLAGTPTPQGDTAS